MSALGAASDDPVAIASRAIREARAAIASKDDLGLREAAEKGWLAVSSAVDVSASILGMKAPGEALGRRQVLREVERRARLKSYSLERTFDGARTILHGECFHEATCPTAAGVLSLLEEVRDFSGHTLAAAEKAARRKR